jgi:hypothetical protein
MLAPIRGVDLLFRYDHNQVHLILGHLRGGWRRGEFSGEVALLPVGARLAVIGTLRFETSEGSRPASSVHRGVFKNISRTSPCSAVHQPKSCTERTESNQPDAPKPRSTSVRRAGTIGSTGGAPPPTRAEDYPSPRTGGEGGRGRTGARVALLRSPILPPASTSVHRTRPIDHPLAV